MSLPTRALTRALAIGAVPLLFATAAAAQRTTAPVNRPVREPPARLPKPEGLAITQLSATTVRLSWRAVEGAKNYVLGRSIGTNGFQRINIPPSLQTEYTDSDVRVGVRVSYSVTAVDSAGMASPRAITPDFIPTAMAPDPVTPVDSTRSDSTAHDSTAGPPTPAGDSTPGSTAGSTPRKGTECPKLSLMDGIPVVGTEFRMSTRDEMPTLDAKLTGASISTEWRYRTRETGTWEVWDLINGFAHFVGRVPSGSRTAQIDITRPGRHTPLLYVPIKNGYAGPVCGKATVITEQMFADLTRTGGASAPGSSASPSTSNPSGMPVEVGMPITLKVNERVLLGTKVLAQEWVSLDPDIARLERGFVIGVSAGAARIIGLTGYVDGTVRLNVMPVTVTGLSPRHR